MGRGRRREEREIRDRRKRREGEQAGEKRRKRKTEGIERSQLKLWVGLLTNWMGQATLGFVGHWCNC